MTLPAVITLTQSGLTPALELVDGAIQPPVQPAYMSWLYAETLSRELADTTNANAILSETIRAKAAEAELFALAQISIAVTDTTGAPLTDESGVLLLLS